MEILFTEQFEQAYHKLSKEEKKTVQKALALLGSDPHHPGLHVKKLEGRKNTWEARPSKRLRMTFDMERATITVRNVGEHDKVLKNP